MDSNVWLLVDEFDTFSYSNLLNVKFKMPNVFKLIKLSVKQGQTLYWIISYFWLLYVNFS